MSTRENLPYRIRSKDDVQALWRNIDHLAKMLDELRAAALLNGSAAGGVLGGTYPNPSFAVDMATQAELDTHKSSSDHDGRYYTETELDAVLKDFYAQQTSDVAVTATTVGGASQLVSLGSQTYTNDPYFFEFFCPILVAGATGGTNIIFRDGSTVIGTMGRTGASVSIPIYLRYRHTPGAGSATFNVAAWHNNAGTDTYNAGTGGTAGDGTTDLPIFMRAQRILD